MVSIGVITGSCRRMVRLVETGSPTLLKGVNKCVLRAFFIFTDRFQLNLTQKNLHLLMPNIFELWENTHSERHILRIGANENSAVFSTLSSDVDKILYGRCPQQFRESLCVL
jgi:hypothetical protein